MRADSCLMARYASLDILFDALVTRSEPLAPASAWVCIHPDALADYPLADSLALAERLETFGLRVLITPAMRRPAVELRRYKRDHQS